MWILFSGTAPGWHVNPRHVQNTTGRQVSTPTNKVSSLYGRWYNDKMLVSELALPSAVPWQFVVTDVTNDTT